MKSEKKKLTKSFNSLIEDLFDNYEKYTDDEKAKVREVFNNASELNVILDKYDIEIDFDWKDYFNSLNRYFDSFY